MPIQQFDGPIPGENYTSDTKNYAWHRPPEFKDFDKAIEYISKKLMDIETIKKWLTLIKMGATPVDITQIYLMQGVMAGKWTIDFALILAGPVCHIIVMVAKSMGANITDIGYEEKSKTPSKAFLGEIQKMGQPAQELNPVPTDIPGQAPAPAVEGGGFMSMAKGAPQ